MQSILLQKVPRSEVPTSSIINFKCIDIETPLSFKLSHDGCYEHYNWKEILTFFYDWLTDYVI